MAKRGRPQKKPSLDKEQKLAPFVNEDVPVNIVSPAIEQASNESKLWHKAAWAKFLLVGTSFFVVIGFVINFFSAAADVPSGWDNVKGWIKDAVTDKPDSLNICTFPQKFQKDSLYILITRFEDYTPQISTDCYGLLLEKTIDVIAKNNKIPIRVCYNEKIVSPNKKEDASRLQKQTNADLVIYGTITNIQKSCGNADFCFNVEPADTLLKMVGSNVSLMKYDNKIDAKQIGLEQIAEANFNIGDTSFQDWLFKCFNLKIGMFNPNLYVINKNSSKKEKAVQLFSKAFLFYHIDEISNALDTMNEAIVLNPNMETYYYFRGFLKSILFLSKDAIKDYDKAIFLGCTDNNIYNIRGEEKAFIGDYKNSISDYNKAIELNPKNEEYYYNRAKSKDNIGETVSAIKDLDFAIKINQNDYNAYIERANLNEKLGKDLEALNDYNLAINLLKLSKHKKFHDIYSSRANLNEKLSKHLEALNDINEAIKIFPDNNYYIYKKKLLVKLGKNDEALLTLDYAIKLNPKEAYFLYYERAVLNSDLGNVSEEISDYKKAIELEPNQNQYLYLMVSLQNENEGNYEESLEYLNKYITLNNKTKEDYFRRANLNLKFLEYEEAVKDYNKTIELDPLYTYAYINRGVSKYHLSKYKEAIKDYDKAIELEPEKAFAYYLRAISKDEIDKYEEAIKDFNKAIELDPKDAIAYNKRGLSKEKLGLNSDAEKDFKKAKELGYEDYSIKKVWFFLNAGFLIILFFLQKIVLFIKSKI